MRSLMASARAPVLFLRPAFCSGGRVVQPSTGASRQDLSMILYLFFATLPCDILSGFLVFSDRVVYPIYFSSSNRLGLSPLEDQQCAAALMWTCVTLVYLIAGAILTMRILSPQSLSRAGFSAIEITGGRNSAQSFAGMEVL
jgi:cytochrome c oxidase assembly factor CtaG